MSFWEEYKKKVINAEDFAIFTQILIFISFIMVLAGIFIIGITSIVD